MNADARGWRMALLPDALINPRDSASAPLPDVLGILEDSGYGVLQMPPRGSHGLLLAVIADQVAEYAHHGYAIVAVGVRGESGGGLHWRSMVPLLRHRGVAAPLRHLILPDVDVAVEGRRLAAFLSSYDLPVEEQRRWRV